MITTTNNFNKIAWCYDFLAKIVFGNKLKKSQIILLDRIKDGDSILIMGGGSGWILEEIVVRIKNVKIDYIDSSEKMLQKAVGYGKLYSSEPIKFIHGDENSIVVSGQYDVVIAFYFFDLFRQERLGNVIAILIAAIKAGGILLVADFVISPRSPYWQKALIKFMYLFFKIVSNIETFQLGDYKTELKKHAMSFDYSIQQCQGLITSEVYKKVS